MPKFRSIRTRLVVLSLLLVTSLIITNLMLIHQIRLQNDLIRQQARNIDIIVRVGAAVQTFGDLKYWLAVLAVGQLVLSDQKADEAQRRLVSQLGGLEHDLSEDLSGLTSQVADLARGTAAAVEAYGRGDRVVGNAIVAQGAIIF